jgi:hypothetical protein
LSAIIVVTAVTILLVMTYSEYTINAADFQEPLVKLAEVLAQKVRREAPKLLQAPEYVSVDLHVLMRQAMYTYNLLFYLNADERRESDCYWKAAYTIVALPLIRGMIDCLYNITAILQDPKVNGAWFRKSGFSKALAAFEEDEERYGGQPDWDRWIKKNRDGFDIEIRRCQLTMPEVLAQKKMPWRTLGKYVSDKQPGGTTSPHQNFLGTFLLGRWREYSAMSHGAFEGLMHGAMYYIADSMPHEVRPAMDELHPRILSVHVLRAAAILLFIITELQVHFRFDDDGARINARIHQMWNTLMPVFEVKELYNERYENLMKDSHIDP